MASNAGNDRRVDYIEFGARDLEAIERFYVTVFGWTFEHFGPTYIAFNDGRLDGGFTTATPVRPGGPLVIVYAADLEDVRSRIEPAGGRVIQAPYDFPGGRRFHFADPDGNELAVWSEAQG